MENQPKLNTSKEIIAYLVTQFPNCFIADGEVKPLKIGIFQDLAVRLENDERISKAKLRSALRTYTMSWRYLYSIKEGVQRVDLDGNPCEALTAEHVEHAQQQLKEAKEKVKAQRMAENKTANKKPYTAQKAKPSTKAKSSVNKPSGKVSEVAKQKDKVPSAPRQYQLADLSVLKAGDEVNVSISSKPMKAILLAIEKDNVRIKIPSGMELTVKAEHIVV